VDRTPVDSSSLASVGYDEATRILEIEFRNGSVYRYEQVPPQDYRVLMAAESKGAEFNRKIRPHYPHRRV
jgi:hypothetical protein